MSDIEVRVKGPIFDGSAIRMSNVMMEMVVQKVAQTGYDDVQRMLKRVLQHPTGFYQSQIRVRNMFDSRVVYDNRIIYGPWLEGTSSRNQTTRFKGYATFRTVAQELSKKAITVTENVVHQWVRRMNQ